MDEEKLSRIKLHLLKVESLTRMPLRDYPRPGTYCPIAMFCPDKDYKGGSSSEKVL